MCRSCWARRPSRRGPAARAGEGTAASGKAFLKSYIGVCMEGAVIVLACLIYSAFLSSSTPAEDCVLFLWITLPMLHEAWGVMEAWGFTYKTAAFVWIKRNRQSDGIHWGMGYWARANAEICLLATRGHPKRQAKNVHQVIISHVEEHSDANKAK